MGYRILYKVNEGKHVREAYVSMHLGKINFLLWPQPTPGSYCFNKLEYAQSN